MSHKNARKALVRLIKVRRQLTEIYQIVRLDNGDETMLCAVKSTGTEINIACIRLAAIVPNGELLFTTDERAKLFGHRLIDTPDFKQRAAHDQ